MEHGLQPTSRLGYYKEPLKQGDVLMAASKFFEALDLSSIQPPPFNEVMAASREISAAIVRELALPALKLDQKIQLVRLFLKVNENAPAASTKEVETVARQINYIAGEVTPRSNPSTSPPKAGQVLDCYTTLSTILADMDNLDRAIRGHMARLEFLGRQSPHNTEVPDLTARFSRLAEIRGQCSPPRGKRLLPGLYQQHTDAMAKLIKHCSSAFKAAISAGKYDVPDNAPGERINPPRPAVITWHQAGSVSTPSRQHRLIPPLDLNFNRDESLYRILQIVWIDADREGE